MKGSTLHRSGLTREKMGILAGLSQSDKKQNTRAQLNQYYKTAKTQELDMLWGGVQKSIQKVHGVAKGHYKSPAVYLTVGFMAGVIFMSCITFIVSISTMAPKAVTKIEEKPVNVALIGEEKPSSTQSVPQTAVSQEKYVVKQGDTLTAITVRYFGKYDAQKIEEIQKLNNITNPESISIGQELLIPVVRENP